ncbi:hypothetical protein Q8F57_018525 [Paraburkholderia terrae]|uniref:hypothetical protein n=1 Tax=Paraburkholderia terrae TaxID=311230 RepID=UPI00296AC4EC|nr:hypothetical protein [Paraburkholderia terrae]MDW3655159.1 hypothetical protein [Paraburkholderia terrae]
MKEIYGNGGGGGAGGKETGKNAIFDKRGNRLTGAAREREVARRAGATKGGRGVAAAKKGASRTTAKAPAKKATAAIKGRRK